MKRHLSIPKTSRSRARGIAEAYIHVDVHPSRNRKNRFHELLQDLAEKEACKLFGPNVVIEVNIEDGSVKAKVIVGGMALFNLVVGYGSFREGIDHIIDDGKAFSGYVIENFEGKAHIPEADVMRVEKRLGVPGKIQRFLRAIEKLEANSQSGEDQVAIQRLRQEFLEIIRLLAEPRDRELLISNTPIKYRDRGPLPNPSPHALSRKAILRNEDEDDVA